MVQMIKKNHMEGADNMLEVDTMITLEDGLNYGLLLDAIVNDENYFLAVELDDNEEATDKYKVLKEEEENGDVYVVEEENPLILSKLLEQFAEQMDDIE